MEFYNFVLTYRESDRKLRDMLKNATVAVEEILECKPNVDNFVQQVHHDDDDEMIKTEMGDCTKEFTSNPPTTIPDPIAVKWKCSTCSLECKTRYELRRHRETHQSETNILKSSKTHTQCTICWNEFSSRKALEQHKRDQHSNGTSVGRKSNSNDTVDEYECDICSKKFNSKNKIRQHLPTHINEGRRKFLCVACGSLFCTKFGLTQHISAIHDREQRFHCTRCDRRFAHKHNLKTHMNRHNGHRPYACNVCEKTFYDSSTLNVHTKSVHSGTNAFVCNICEKTFNRNGNLKIHMVRTHHIQQSKAQGSGQRVIKKVETKLK